MSANEQVALELVQVGSYFDRMSVTPAHWKAGLILFFSFVIEAWEMMIIILVSGSVGKEFNLSGPQVGSLIGSLFLAMIPGALIWGKVADRLGRRRSMMLGFILYGVFSMASAFSVNYPMLWTMRFCAGLGLSGVLVTAFPYFIELLPVQARGKATVYLASGWPIGFLIAIGVTYLFTALGWRWSVGVSSLAGLWSLAILCLPESPYWLCGQGRQDEAKQVINYLSGQHFTQELATRPLQVDAFKQGSYLETVKGIFLKITLVQILINFAFSWGYWGLTSWMPILLGKRGLSSPQGLKFMAISAVFMFPGYIASSYLPGKFGRKRVMFWFVLMSAVAGFGFACSRSLAQMYLFNFALSFFSLGAWGVWDTWMAELYPTEIRGVSYSLGLCAQRLANTLAPITIGAMLAANTSFPVTVSFISVFLVITFISSLFLPETEGQILT
jgi:putative MFS transporter